jgi:hypothetical protein
VVLDSQFIDQKQLSKAWLSVTLTSRIVDIRAVRGFQAIAQYLTKYLLKTTALPEGIDPAREDELYGLFRRARFVRFQGTLKPRKGEEIWKPDYPKDWTPVTSLMQLLADAANGDQTAENILMAIAHERLFSEDFETPYQFPP